MSSGQDGTINRRSFLQRSGVALSAPAAAAALAACKTAQQKEVQPLQATPTTPPAPETYETHAKGIRILPGAWRPHYPWEHIAWISSAWPSQDYLWLDFPEAIFTSQGIIFLSHVNPPIPTVYSELPAVSWEKTKNGIGYNRKLPSGIEFGGEITCTQPDTADLTLFIDNGSRESLNNITLQTCAFLRANKEFADYTRDNKYVHVRGKGWLSYTEAAALPENEGPYRLGWRDRGRLLCDVPGMITMSSAGERGVAMTWLEDTLSMVSNANHPCMHADPKFHDLAPGEQQTIRGRIIFFEGPPQDFNVHTLLSP
ncbi:MAG: hypothetical protein HYV26_18745 [Candidatus Hydrogenedentes bacterium]|nr:hypothetical protein [Candidatus Hydrogenedentota bacterium]